MYGRLIAAGGLWLAVLFRLLHVFNGRHLIVSPDSYYFHTQARYLAEGLPSMPARGSGLTYIVGGLGKVIGMDWASAVVPLLLSAGTGLLVYCGARKLWGSTVGLFSLLAFAVAFPAVFIGAAGNIDRDCLHLLLIPLCLFAVYFLRENFVLWSVVIAASCVVLWYEWGLQGPLLVGLYALPFVAAVFLWRWRHGGLEGRYQIMVVGGCVAGIVLAAVYWHEATDIFQKFQGTTIGEMQMLDGRELLAYLLLIPFMFLGIMVLFKRKGREKYLRADVFLTLWIVVSLVLGLVFSRMYLWGIPAFCMLAGLGMRWLWSRKLMPRAAFVSLVVVAVIFSGYYAWNVDLRDPRAAATQEYQQAMKWLEAHAGSDDKVLAWWDWGYMIEDLSGREAVMDNGRWDQDDLVLLAKALWSADDGHAARWIARTGADWLVLYQDVPPSNHVAQTTFGVVPSQADLDASLMMRAFSSDYCSNYLPLAYRSENVVILRCLPAAVSG